jgi:ligand-binding sensor domain-containing protein
LQAQNHENSFLFYRLLLGESYSQNNVSSIIQDRTGFMWFGTRSGLIKYDGYNVVTFTNIPGDNSSMSNNSVNVVFEDSFSNIWVGTDEGLNRFDKGTQLFTRYLISDKNIANRNRITSIVQDNSGDIWIGTEHGLAKFDPLSNQLFPIGFEQENHITVLYKDKNGIVWAGTYSGKLIKINSYDNSIKRIEPDWGKNNLKIKSITALFEDSKNNFWIGTFNGLAKYDRSKNVLMEISLRKAKPANPLFVLPKVIDEFIVHSIVEDLSGKLWISSQHGLFSLNKQNKLVFYTNLKGNYFSISFNYITSLFVDRTGILWIGTYGYGLNKLFPKLQNFEMFSSKNISENNISIKSVRAITEDDLGNLWIGGYNGLNKIDRRKNTVSKYLNNEPIYSILPDPDRPNEILWIGKDVGGFCKYEIKSNKLISYKYTKPNLISGEVIYSIISSKDGFLWIGTDQGLFRFDQKREISVAYKHNPKDKNSLSNSKVNVVFEDKKGLLWLGTDVGVNVFNRKTNKIKHFFNTPNDSSSLSYNTVLSINEDNENQIWIGTAGGGLNRFNRKSGKFFHYLKKDGLPDNVVYSILFDENDNIWISTNNGISNFIRKENRFRIYDEKFGLQNNEFNLGAVYKSKSGEMFFGGIGGFNAFFPSKIIETKNIPTVAITDFKIFNKSVKTGEDPNGRIILTKPISESDEIHLSYLDNAFSFEFASLEYFDAKKTKYAYKMEGLDKNWNFVGKRRFVAFNSIPSGKYIFKVKAANSEGTWSKVAAVAITVSPPFWKTWWFYLFIILFLSVILYSIHKYRINQLLKIERLRVKLASDLHDDIGLTLTKISMQSDIIKYGIDKQNTEKILSRISELSNQAIGTMRDIVWSIDARNDDINNLIIKMKDESYSILRSKNITVGFEHSSVKSDNKLSFEIRQNLYLMFKEAINNIYKHSNATEVKVTLLQENGFLKMIIWDNGNSYVAKNEHSGQGTKNMKMRVEKIGGKFTNETQNGYKVIFSGIKIK